MNRVAINGLGRIGRAALKLLMESDELDLVAVNDLANADNLAYLIKYDTVYGRYQSDVSSETNTLLIDGQQDSISPRPIRRTCPGASSRSTSYLSAPARSGASRT